MIIQTFRFIESRISLKDVIYPTTFDLSIWLIGFT